jgi:NAD+ diphosphatase
VPPGRFLAALEPLDDGGDVIVFHVGAGLVVVEEGVDVPDGSHYLGALDGRGCWAASVDGDLDGGLNLHMLWGRVDEDTWTVAGRAVQLVEWDRTHRFCGRCGEPTMPVASERARRCPACGLMAFPRLAPAIIVLVERDDGRALLARGIAFPIPMYSCLAGFVEPGETMEQAVHREVHEEVGIEVEDVRYQASQPWPFPHSLMLGFTARYAGGELRLDEREIVDAGWYAPDELPMIPPAMSIARRLIDDWLARAERG